MLTVTIPSSECYDERRNLFLTFREQTIRLEHSLVSISKWEAKWHKPFLSAGNKTREEMLDYIRCMTITQNVDPDFYYSIRSDVIDQINKYIEDPRTATTFREKERKSRGREIITSELIYYWMIAFNIPFECQTWHLNRLLTLIRICEIKNEPPKKRTQREIAQEYAAINEAQRKRFHSKG